MRARAPALLTRTLSTRQLGEVSGWWRGLAAAERRTLRRDTGRPPAGVLARFVGAEPPEENGEGTTDFYEYLVNHEIFLENERTFHICSAHPEARALLAAGHMPADFQCPRADAACPMRALLDMAPGRNVRLSLLRSKAPSEDRGHE